MKTKEFLNKYMNELEHFFMPGFGGWPISVTKSCEELCSVMKCLEVKDGLLILNKKVKPNSEILLALYKFKYEESEKRYYSLYNKVRKIVDEF